MTQSKINIVQTGKVVYLGSKPTREDHTIKNFPTDSLTIDHNGVVDNYHSKFCDVNPVKLHRYKFTKDYVNEMYANGYRLFRITQVYLLDLNLAAFLKKYGITISPGDVGEQILIDGIDLNVLHQGSIISIGDQVKLKVIAPRTYCGRFGLDLKLPNDPPRKHWEYLLRSLLGPEGKKFTDRYTPVGVYTQVISQGVIKLNDTVIADPTCSLHYGADKLMIPMYTKEINDSRVSWLTREQVISMRPDIPLSIIDSYYDPNYGKH